MKVCQFLLIGRPKEHKSLTLLISWINVKNRELSLGAGSLIKRSLGIWVYMREIEGGMRESIVVRSLGITTLNSCLKGPCLVLLVNY